MSEVDRGDDDGEDSVDREREFCIDNLLVRIHFIVEMIWWTGLAPWEVELTVEMTTGRMPWTLPVPSIMITTRDIVARCTPPSMAPAPASAYDLGVWCLVFSC